MSGHSKWSQIKRQKGVTDTRRGADFTKAANAITITARQAGGNPESNFKLRLAIEAARKLNMPKDNIERAISRGTGAGKEGLNLEEVTYEGYGPAGVAVLVETVTDNRQRTAQDVRGAFERLGGNISGPSSVTHLFAPIGEITVKIKAGSNPDDLLLLAADAGASDVETDSNEAIIYCAASELDKVKNYLAAKDLEVVEAKLSRKSVTNVKIEDESKAAAILSLVNKLDDLPDVQKVYANFDIPDEILKKVVA